MADRRKSETADAAFLELSDVAKYYGETGALKGVSCSVARGEWVTVMGPSGSGKTTLLSIVGGLAKPSEGRVTFEGAEISTWSEADLARFRRDNVGFVFQQHHLIPYLTGLENVMMAQYLHSMPDEREAIQVLERVGLEHRLRHLPAQMSGGEQQRVGIARALVNSPTLLLADEPTGSLDRENASAVMQMLSEIRAADEFTVVMVTHDPWVAEWGEREIVLEDGRIIAEKESAKRGRG